MPMNSTNVIAYACVCQFRLFYGHSKVTVHGINKSVCRVIRESIWTKHLKKAVLTGYYSDLGEYTSFRLAAITEEPSD